MRRKKTNTRSECDHKSRDTGSHFLYFLCWINFRVRNFSRFSPFTECCLCHGACSDSLTCRTLNFREFVKRKGKTSSVAICFKRRNIQKTTKEIEIFFHHHHHHHHLFALLKKKRNHSICKSKWRGDLKKPPSL